ncbi:MAG: hypothetical protein ACOZIN_20350 [Myxococcota bacterium]
MLKMGRYMAMRKPTGSARVRKIATLINIALNFLVAAPKMPAPTTASGTNPKVKGNHCVKHSSVKAGSFPPKSENIFAKVGAKITVAVADHRSPQAPNASPTMSNTVRDVEGEAGDAGPRLIVDWAEAVMPSVYTSTVENGQSTVVAVHALARECH